jgi:hypothetical protein
LTLALCLAGLAAIVYGSWLVYHPAGFIVGGLLLFLLSLIVDRESKSQR